MTETERRCQIIDAVHVLAGASFVEIGSIIDNMAEPEPKIRAFRHKHLTAARDSCMRALQKFIRDGNQQPEDDEQ
jgi:hypothetical protein